MKKSDLIRKCLSKEQRAEYDSDVKDARSGTLFVSALILGGGYVVRGVNSLLNGDVDAAGSAFYWPAFTSISSLAYYAFLKRSIDGRYADVAADQIRNKKALENKGV